MRHLVALIALGTVLPLVVTGQGTAAGPFATAVLDPGDPLSTQRVREAGASAVQVFLEWRTVAPSTRPLNFDPSNPNDPAYYWKPMDDAVKRAAANRLRPLVSIFRAPDWATASGAGTPGTVRPDPNELGKFARAAALRYSGTFAGLPRVHYWQAWAEPNLFYHLNPQRVNGKPASPSWYRQLANAFATAVHSVHRDNLVVAGSLAPFEVFASDRKTSLSVAPLEFMRLMLCMSKKLKPTCRTRSQFDVWAHNPYTWGGPNHSAHRPDDVSLGDLPEMKRVLNAAVRARRIVSRQPVRFWVTEFGWDTSPPDPRGVPLQEHARWVSEAFYRMWQSGVSLVVWLQMRDRPMSEGVEQQGLYHRGATPEQDVAKPALQAFRFPFVALPNRGQVVVWGRTPRSARGAVMLEHRRRARWKRLAVVRANRYGIFRRTFKMRPGGYMRAVVGRTDRSLPFAVKKTRDRRVCPFGTLPGCDDIDR